MIFTKKIMSLKENIIVIFTKEINRYKNVINDIKMAIRKIKN